MFSQSLVAQDTIILSDYEHKLQNGVKDEIFERMSFHSYALRMYHLVHLLKIVHTELPKYQVVTANCWWLTSVVHRALGRYHGQSADRPTVVKKVVQFFRGIFGNPKWHTERIIHQYGCFLDQCRRPLYHVGRFVLQ